jgi:GT2 family glycosyltransferase
MLLGESRLGGEPFAYTPKVSPGTGNLMLHRSVFEQIGTFDEAFAVRAEDTDLFCRMWRAGIEAWYVPTAVVQHVTPPARLEVEYLMRLATLTGTSVAERERKTSSLLRFAARYLVKATLYPVILGVKQLAVLASRRAEAQLGVRCHRQFVRQYTRRGCELLWAEVRRWLPKARLVPVRSATSL